MKCNKCGKDTYESDIGLCPKCQVETHDERLINKTIDRCINIVQEIKDKHNEDKKSCPINYGTICSIIIAMENLKEEENE